MTARWRILVLLLLCAALAGRAQAQFFSRAELTKPLSKPVEAALAAFVERCAVEKQTQLGTHMQKVLAEVDAAAHLTPEEKTALEEPARSAVAAAVQAWKPEALTALRVYLPRSSTSAALRAMTERWKPDQIGTKEPVEHWMLPEERPEWLVALRGTLGPERMDAWQKASAEKQQKVDEEIDAYLTRWLAEARGPLNEDVRAKIEFIKTRLNLPADLEQALIKAGGMLLDGVAAKERQRGKDMLRTLPEKARQSILGQTPFYLRFDRPLGETWETLWQDTVAKTLPQELLARWKPILLEERKKEDAELAKAILPTETYTRQQMETALEGEIEALTNELGLDAERKEDLKTFAEKAVDAALAAGRKIWIPQARTYLPEERKRSGGNLYFGLAEELQAVNQPVWKNGLKTVLKEDELQKISAERKERDDRARDALARATVAELDVYLALSDEQRVHLAPLVASQMDALLEQQQSQRYWNFSALILFQQVDRIPPEKLQTVLDASQVQRLKSTLASLAQANAGVPPTTQQDQAQEPVADIKAVVSEHQYRLFVTERARLLNIMLPKVEEAKRVLKLPDSIVERLTTAAKGAVEVSLGKWRQTMEQYVSQAVESATGLNIRQALAGTQRVNLSRNNDKSPAMSELWQQALQEELTAEQLQALKDSDQARFSYRLKAMAGMCAGQTDRKERLNKDQHARLEAQVTQVLHDYLPDIELYMSSNWHLQHYYAQMPTAGVPEKELQAILTPQQWAHFKDHDLPEAMQTWENIENHHKSRLKQGGDAGQIFNGGFIRQ